MPDIRKTVDKGIAYVKRYGFVPAVKRTIRKAWLSRPVDYEKWLKQHRPDQKTLQKQKQVPTGDWPSAGLILKKGRQEAKWEEKTQMSLQMQTCQNLRLCCEEDGFEKDWYLIAEPGCIFRPEAIFEFLRYARRNEKADWFFCDHDELTEENTAKHPFCKPQFDPVFLKEMNYVGAAVLVSGRLLKTWGRSMEELMETDLYEDLLELSDISGKAIRIPKLLYSAAQGSAAQSCACRKNREYKTEETAEQPKLSVLIPNKDHIEDLKICITSLLEMGGYDNLEVLIIENNSEEKETFEGYEELQKKDERIRVLTWKKAYNYSAINNFGAEAAKGSYLLLLNNDTKVKKQGSLLELMNRAAEEKTGAVGARLLFEDHTIQHGGVVLGYGGIAGHAFEGMADADYEKTLYASAVRQMSAVTAACMLVKKQVFCAVGGFTEELCVAYNDIDFCMKLQNGGWRVVYDPKAVWYHYESRTRGLELSAEKAERVGRETRIFLEKWKKEIDRGDRFYNPNLTLELPDFSLIR